MIKGLLYIIGLHVKHIDLMFMMIFLNYHVLQHDKVVLVIILNFFKLVQVNLGLSCLFSQDVVAVNTADKQCCVFWELNKRAVLTPDVDSVLNSLADL